MTRILVPYHVDEHTPDLPVPVPTDVTVEVEPPAGDGWQRIGVLQEAVARRVAEAERATVLSGDCLVALGTVAGLQRAGHDPGIVWFDAHGDVQTMETTTSGYLGGMALRVLTGYRPELIGERLGLRPVPEERIVLGDARDLDPPEVDFLAGSAIQRLDVSEVDVSTVPGGALYVHVDLDVCDPEELPEIRFPAPGGPAVADVFAALHRVLDTRRVVGLTLACTWHPRYDPSHLGAAMTELVNRYSSQTPA